MDIKATAHDSQGNIILCSFCDKPAGMAAIGFEAQLAYCSDHSPVAQNYHLNKYAATFVYRPDLTNKSQTDNILKDSWVIDFRDEDNNGH